MKGSILGIERWRLWRSIWTWRKVCRRVRSGLVTGRLRSWDKLWRKVWRR